MTTDPRWRTSANCRGLDPDLFYPEPGDSLDEPKAVCAGCVVAAACLEYALSRPEPQGVLGGKSANERRIIRKARRAAARAAA